MSRRHCRVRVSLFLGGPLFLSPRLFIDCVRRVLDSATTVMMVGDCVYYTSGDRREGEKDTLREYVDKMSSERETRERERGGERTNKNVYQSLNYFQVSLVNKPDHYQHCTEYLY